MAKEREITYFLSVVALSIDALLMAFNLWRTADFLPLLEGWDLLKALLATGALSALAIRFRSWLFGVAAMVLGVVAVVEEVTGYALTIDVMNLFGYDPFARRDGVLLVVYGELWVLGIMALVALTALWVASIGRPGFRAERNRIILFLAAEFVFAVGVGFLAEFWDSGALELLQEVGERVVMSLLVGYLLTLVLRWRMRMGSAELLESSSQR